jgi:hypothetical protein
MILKKVSFLKKKNNWVFLIPYMKVSYVKGKRERGWKVGGDH